MVIIIQKPFDNIFDNHIIKPPMSMLWAVDFLQKTPQITRKVFVKEGVNSITKPFLPNPLITIYGE